MTNVVAAKSRLRAQIAELMSQKSPADLKEAGLMAAEHFSRWLKKHGEKINRVSLFRSLKDEIAMAPMDLILAGLDIARFFPAKKALDAASSFELGENPDVKANAADMDIILVPGRAFDRAGRRLGRGGGHYDRCLTPLSLLKKGPILIGIALEEQIVPLVPSEAHDVVMDFICTPQAMFKAKRASND